MSILTINDVTSALSALTLSPAEPPKTDKLVAEFAKITFDIPDLSWERYLNKILPEKKRAYVHKEHYLGQAQWRVDQFCEHYPSLSKDPNIFAKIQLVALTLTIKSLEERTIKSLNKIPLALEVAFLTACDFKIPKVSLVQEIECICFKEPTVDFSLLTQTAPGTYLIQKIENRHYRLLVQTSLLINIYEFKIDDEDNIVLDGKKYDNYPLFLSSCGALHEITNLIDLYKQRFKNDKLKVLRHDIENAPIRDEFGYLQLRTAKGYIAKNPTATFEEIPLSILRLLELIY